MQNVLVTGGAGYIGSHTVLALSGSGFGVVVLDNFSNSNECVIKDLQKITGTPIVSVYGDIRDYKTLQALFIEFDIGMERSKL